MEKKEFSSLFKDLITHLYDYAVLETHPLIEVITLPRSFHGSRGEYIRQMILEEVERFKPAGKDHSLHDIEWRPYNILNKRYVEGASLRELSGALSLSERQLRRDNSRAVQALAGRIWDKLVASGAIKRMTADDDRDDLLAFDVNVEVLILNEVIDGIMSVFEKRIQAEGYSITLEKGTDPIRVLADRIITRQILISLVSYCLNFSPQLEIELRTDATAQKAVVAIQSALVDPWRQEDKDDYADLLEAALKWSRIMDAVIHEKHPDDGQLGFIELAFSLPLAEQALILVVDDQQPTHQMFLRFLSRTDYQIIGITDPSKTLSMARQLKPALITLDVMMPQVDGWEILQALKTDRDTKNIPVLVCSAWEEPALAKSLGASGFLKKPIRQRDLLSVLEQLNL
jgi:CheY-like chemotaxis protein